MAHASSLLFSLREIYMSASSLPWAEMCTLSSGALTQWASGIGGRLQNSRDSGFQLYQTVVMASNRPQWGQQGSRQTFMISWLQVFRSQPLDHCQHPIHMQKQSLLSLLFTPSVANVVLILQVLESSHLKDNSTLWAFCLLSLVLHLSRSQIKETGKESRNTLSSKRPLTNIDWYIEDIDVYVYNMYILSTKHSVCVHVFIAYLLISFHNIKLDLSPLFLENRDS